MKEDKVTSKNIIIKKSPHASISSKASQNIKTLVTDDDVENGSVLASSSEYQTTEMDKEKDLQEKQKKEKKLKDRQARLIESMPKKQDHFLNSGPPALLQKELELKEEIVQEIRQRRLYRKKMEDQKMPSKNFERHKCDFQQDIINSFNTMYELGEQKKEEAMLSFVSNRRHCLEAELQLARCREEILVLQQRKNELLKKDNCKWFDTIDKFCNNIERATSGKFKSMYELMERYNTLKASLNCQVKHFFKGREILDAVENVKREMLEHHTESKRRKLAKIQSLKEHLKELKYQNSAQKKEIDREDLLYTEKSSQLAVIENGLQYIFDILMTYRHFTQETVMRYDTTLDKIDSIADVIETYELIIDSWAKRGEHSESAYGSRRVSVAVAKQK